MWAPGDSQLNQSTTDTAKRAVGRFELHLFEVAFRWILAVAAILSPFNILSNDVRVYWFRSAGLSWHHLPYFSFLWEYPPLTALFLVYRPPSGASLLTFYVLFTVTTIGMEYGSLILIRRARPDAYKSITVYWSIVVVPISALVWFRFDYMSVLFATIALLSIERKRHVVAPIVLGFLTKLWPVFIVVPLFAQRRFKSAALAVGLCAVLTAIWAAVTPSGFHNFLLFRQGSGFQLESIPGSLLLLFCNHPALYMYGAFNIEDSNFNWLLTMMNVLSLVLPAVIAIIALLRCNRNDIALTAGVIAVVLCCDRLISAQFVVWMAPFIAYIWPEQKRVGYLYALVVVLTDVVIMTYNPLVRHNRALAGVLVARNVALIWFTVSALRLGFGRPRARTQVGELAST
jgi:hypothetical protein